MYILYVTIILLKYSIHVLILCAMSCFSFLTILQQSAEVQETVTHPPKQKWVKMDRANSFGVSSSYIEGVYGPVTNTCGQVCWGEKNKSMCFYCILMVKQSPLFNPWFF